MLKEIQGRLAPQDGRTDLLEIIDIAQVLRVYLLVLYYSNTNFG
jgi:hypothetical protein